MSYYLQAIIGRRHLLEPRVSAYGAASLARLNLGLALIPLTDELLDEIGADGYAGRFYKLTPAVQTWIEALSADGPVAYVEADFFGGVGSQCAVVWSAGRQVLAPVYGDSAINQALAALGISTGTSQDEFAAVGLPRHRDTPDWLKDAIPINANA